MVDELQKCQIINYDLIRMTYNYLIFEIHNQQSIQEMHTLKPNNGDRTIIQHLSYQSNAQPTKYLDTNQSIFRKLRDSKINSENHQKIIVSRNSSLGNGFETKRSSSQVENQTQQNKEPNIQEGMYNQLCLKMVKMQQRVKQNERMINKLTDKVQSGQGKQIAQWEGGYKMKLMNENYLIRDYEKNSENYKDLKIQINNLKKQMENIGNNNKIREQIFHMQTSIRSTILMVKSEINSQIKEISTNTVKLREEIQNNIQASYQRLNQQMLINIQQIQKQLQTIKLFSNISKLVKSLKKGSEKCIQLKYNQTLGLKHKTILNTDQSNQIIFKQTLYLVDKDGYLLDQNSYYLLDSNGEQIKLSPDHLAILKPQKNITQ